MKEFSYGEAWASGFRFFAGSGRSHALILIGMGIALPFILQLLAIGRPLGMMNPAMAAGEAVAPFDSGAAIVLATLAAGYLFQLGSYFASWRLGFVRGETLSGVIAFGLPAALLAATGFVLLIAIAAAFAGVAPIAGVVAGGIAFLALLCVVCTLIAALLATGICLTLALAMVFGTLAGNVGFAATMVGGSGFVVVLLLIASGLILWLAARLSCTTSILAERRSFDVVAAMAESWRLTWEHEWRIMRYLGVVGLISAVVLIGGAVVIGAGISAAFRDGPAPALEFGMPVVQLAASIPLAYLIVLVPAGIHRQLAGSTAPAEIFA